MAISINELNQISKALVSNLNGENPNNWEFICNFVDGEHCLVLAKEDSMVEIFRGGNDLSSDTKLLNKLLNLG